MERFPFPLPLWTLYIAILVLIVKKIVPDAMSGLEQFILILLILVWIVGVFLRASRH